MPAIPDLLVSPDRPLTVKVEGGALKMEGPLVVFSGPSDPDLTGDFFTRDTDFGVLSMKGTATVTAFFHHGLDAEVKARPIGYADIELRDDEVWATYWISERDAYESRIAGRIKRLLDAGKLGQSSGALSHTVEREEADDDVFHITRWTLGEASPTPTPAEPRTRVVPVKSLIALPAPPVPPAYADALAGFRAPSAYSGALRAFLTANPGGTIHPAA